MGQNKRDRYFRICAIFLWWRTSSQRVSCAFFPLLEAFIFNLSTSFMEISDPVAHLRRWGIQSNDHRSLCSYLLERPLRIEKIEKSPDVKWATRSKIILPSKKTLCIPALIRISL